jgi:hypothetical protein
MPTDKSPGPDGFNGAFLKHCWPSIKDEFYKLFFAFHEGNLDIQTINSAFITLIPMKDHKYVNDYRPISHVSLALKFLTKIWANRMQKVIIPAIHKNQYGFIKSRTIHDCLAWAFEYIHLRHKSKREIVILKLDFEKAFDKVEYSAIILMLEHLGFWDIWINWINCILKSANTCVLLNVVPGKKIHCKRGVRQGDPISPLLFVSTVELLQFVINYAWHNGDISLPLDNFFGPDYPIIQYADDTLIILPACPVQLMKLKTLLEQFSASTSLFINYK